MRVEMVLRAWPRFRVVNFLVEAGGEVTESLSVVGDRWSAYLEALEPDPVGIVNVPRDRLVIEGEEQAVERIHAFMRHKTRRHHKE
jgi:hypothetical protein